MILRRARTNATSKSVPLRSASIPSRMRLARTRRVHGATELVRRDAQPSVAVDRRQRELRMRSSGVRLRLRSSLRTTSRSRRSSSSEIV